MAPTKEGQPVTLAAKMAAIMGDLPTMIKNGQNVQQKYQYVTAEDVKAAIRPLLKKHKVALFAEMVEVQRESNINKNSNTVITVLAKMRFTLVCADSGETKQCDWYGEANDFADKAVNKAATAAEKYWLMNTFLASTTEAESDGETIEAAAPAPVSARTLAQLDALAARRYGRQWDTKRAGFARYTSNQRTPEMEDLTEGEARKAIEGLEEWLKEQGAAQ